MRLLMLAKYPPIQGGVSASVFRAAHELAENGHRVHVVTNAGEVESGFRLSTSAPTHSPAAGRAGNVSVSFTTPVGPSRFIPTSEAFEAKLYGRACEYLGSNPCDAIIGWYLQPYGFVAAILARTKRLPVILIHAGSDVFRLPDHPDFRYSIKDTLQQADVILTFQKPPILARLADLGAPLDKCHFLGGARLPWWFYERGHILSYGESSRNERLPRGDRNHRVHKPPVILHYSNIAEPKGTWDLIECLNRLALRGTAFQFNCVLLGWEGHLDHLRAMLRDRPLLWRRTRLIPPVAPWAVPELILTSDIVSVLERKFPIPIHSPKLAREVLAMGRCLLVSDEVAAHTSFADSLIEGKTAMIVKDPTDHDEHTEKLGLLISEPHLRRSLGTQGQMLSEFVEGLQTPFGPYSTAIEAACRELRIGL